MLTKLACVAATLYVRRRRPAQGGTLESQRPKGDQPARRELFLVTSKHGTREASAQEARVELSRPPSSHLSFPCSGGRLHGSRLYPARDQPYQTAGAAAGVPVWRHAAPPPPCRRRRPTLEP